jgi:hypothetical protein
LIGVGPEIQAEGEIEVKDFAGGLYAVVTCKLFVGRFLSRWKTQGFCRSICKNHIMLPEKIDDTPLHFGLVHLDGRRYSQRRHSRGGL